MRVNPRQLRNCLGHFATGVTVVSCGPADAPHGATANSFTAVSMEPALVLVSLDRRSRGCGLLEGNPFTVNVLREPQDDLALHFGGRSTADPVRWESPTDGLAPRLADSLATIACSPWRS